MTKFLYHLCLNLAHCFGNDTVFFPASETQILRRTEYILMKEGTGNGQRKHDGIHFMGDPS